MAKTKTDEKVMAMVEKELQKKPDISVDELQEKATSINKDVASLTARQFHARYPLQIKRRKAIRASEAPGKKAKKKPAAKKRKGRTTKRKAGRAAAASAGSDVNRDAVRDSFLQFASELAAAEARKDLVKVLAGVDKYVDRVVKAATR